MSIFFCLYFISDWNSDIKTQKIPQITNFLYDFLIQNWHIICKIVTFKWNNMAIVCEVKTPLFFSESKPYMIVLFVEEYENRFRIGSCDSPRYLQIYDLRIIYPELKDVYEAKKHFVEEMKIGNREPLKLCKFLISDLTDGKHSSIRSTLFGKELYLWVGVYDNNNEVDVAKRMLSFGINHGIFKWDD